MKPADITSNHTRKEMNAIAEDIGIENPSSFKNKTELANTMVPLLEEKMGEENVPDGIKEVKSILKQIRGTKISMDNYKQKMKLLVEKEKSGDINKARELLAELLERGELLVDLNDRLNVLDETLETIEDEELIREVEDSIDSVVSKPEEDIDEEALREVEEAIEYIEGYKDRIAARREELEDKIVEAKNRLSELRETSLKINEVKKEFKEGLNAKKENQIELALEKIDEALNKSQLVMDIHERLKEGKELIKKLKKHDFAFHSYLDMLKTGKEKANEGEYKYSMQLLNDAINDMHQELEEFEKVELRREEVEKKVRDILRKIEAIENAIKLVKKDIDDILR